jgi:hypothetical protein
VKSKGNETKRVTQISNFANWNCMTTFGELKEKKRKKGRKKKEYSP